VQGGESMHIALEKMGVFSNFFVAMTRIGEESGLLADIMRQLADYYDKEAHMGDELRNAMIYPFIVSVLMIGVIIAALLLVIPGYAQIFEANGVELPAATASLISISEFIANRGTTLVAAIILMMLLMRYFMSFGLGQMLAHRIMLCSKTYVKVLNQRFARALELLLISGSDLVLSVEIAKNVIGNRVLSSRVDSALERILRGRALSMALEEVKGIDGMLVNMIKLGEETGQLPMTVRRCADYFQKEMDTQISRLNRLVEPVITLMLGAVLAFVMLAVMLPTFHMANII